GSGGEPAHQSRARPVRENPRIQVLRRQGRAGGGSRAGGGGVNQGRVGDGVHGRCSPAITRHAILPAPRALHLAPLGGRPGRSSFETRARTLRVRGDISSRAPQDEGGAEGWAERLKRVSRVFEARRCARPDIREAWLPPSPNRRIIPPLPGGAFGL